MPIFGSYPCCKGDLDKNYPEDKVYFEPEECPHCGAKVWHVSEWWESRTYMEDEFLQLYDVNHETKHVTPKPKVISPKDKELQDMLVELMVESAAKDVEYTLLYGSDFVQRSRDSLARRHRSISTFGSLFGGTYRGVANRLSTESLMPRGEPEMYWHYRLPIPETSVTVQIQTTGRKPKVKELLLCSASQKPSKMKSFGSALPQVSGPQFGLQKNQQSILAKQKSGFRTSSSGIRAHRASSELVDIVRPDPEYLY